MLKKKSLTRFVGIIPARGGSVGLPRKNLMEVQGISLIARAVLIAKMIKEIEWIIVSTDDKEIALEAERAGATIPFLRPKYLSREDTPMISVLEHALGWFRSSISDVGHLCEGVILLQPTSPMRKTDHIIGAINLYIQSRREGIKVAGVHTVSPVPEKNAPWNLWRIENNEMKKDDGRIESTRMNKIGSLNRSGLYYRNGAAVVLDPNCLSALTLAERPVLPYVIELPLVTIDTLFDLLYIEYCSGRLEPDPFEIGWGSHQIHGLSGKGNRRSKRI